MRKLFVLTMLAAVSLAALAPAAGAAGTAGGTASGANTLVSLTVGSQTVQVGVDNLASTWSALRHATAGMVLGRAGSLSVAGASRDATSSGTSGSSAIGSHTVSIGGLASLTVADGSVGAFVAPDHVSSSADLTAGATSILGGVASLGTAAMHTAAEVASSKSTVTRTVSLGNVDVLSIGDLLGQLGVDPLALACGAVQTAGAALGVATTAACSQLSAAQGAIGAGQDALAAQVASLEAAVTGFSLSQVQSDVSTVTALVCGPLDLVCQAAGLAQLLSLNATQGLGLDLSGLLFDAAKTAVLDKLDTLVQDFTNLDILNGGVTQASAGVCSDVSGALTNVVNGVPSLAATINPLLSTVNATCATLAGTLNTLLDTPLLSIGTVNVSLDTVAAPGAPAATVGGTIGSVKIGAVSLPGGLLTLGPDLASKVTSLTSSVTSALSGLGIGLPVPTIEILKTSSSKGKQPDGTWYADASLTGVHVAIPSASLSIPSTDPLALLSGTAGLAPVRHRSAAPVTSPAIDVQAVKFTAASTFAPPAGRATLPSGETLPVTGTSDASLAVMAMVMVAAAFATRRFMFAR
jgi:hypothetical protein